VYYIKFHGWYDLLFHNEGKAKVAAIASESEFHPYDDFLTNISQNVLNELLMPDFHEEDFAGYGGGINGQFIWQIWPQTYILNGKLGSHLIHYTFFHSLMSYDIIFGETHLILLLFIFSKKGYQSDVGIWKYSFV
jgi:hypothetical protein